MVGQTVGKYRVEERIGRGGMGTVYRAVDEVLRREVAIKILNSELNDPEVAKRFRAEAITVARLNHSGIATVYELFEHDGQWLMVMEFVRGETLERLIERAGPLSSERAADLCIQALSALTHAHGLGVVHRDLKPANLMLTDAGVVKIMDFGIARVSGSEHLTSAGFMMGTPAYMAPEQVLGHEVDARTDLYAMGVVLYRLTTARLPFRGETPFALAQSQVNDPPTPVRTAREGLPAWLEQVVTRALAKSPAERFQSAAEFRDVLQRCLAGFPVENLFEVAGPTGVLRTPMGLSGAFGSSAGSRSGAIPTSGPSTGAHSGMTDAAAMPTAHNPTPAYLSTAPTMSVSTAQTMMSASSTGAGPAPVQPSGSLPMGTGAVPAASGGTAATNTAGMSGTAPQPVAPASSKPAAKSPAMMIGIAAGVVLLIVVAIFAFRKSPTAPAPPQTAADAAPATDAPSPASNPAASPATGTPAANPATATTAAPANATPPQGANAASAPASPGGGTQTSPPGASPGATTAPAAGGTPTSPASAAPGATAPGATGARADAGRATGRAGAAPVDDTLIVFSDAKYLTFDGRKGHDQDAVIHFGGGQITIVPKKGGAALVAVPYKRITHAIYTHAKDPRWDGTLASLPDNPDIPGFMRGTRNWLVMQSKTDCIVLYLNDANSADVLQTFETRTGLKIDHTPEGGR